MLSLQWNCLRGTKGIEALTGLRSLDLGFNFIAVISEIVHLSGAAAELLVVKLRLASLSTASDRTLRRCAGCMLNLTISSKLDSP